MAVFEIGPIEVELFDREFARAAVPPIGENHAAVVPEQCADMRHDPPHSHCPVFRPGASALLSLSQRRFRSRFSTRSSHTAMMEGRHVWRINAGIKSRSLPLGTPPDRLRNSLSCWGRTAFTNLLISAPF